MNRFDFKNQHLKEASIALLALAMMLLAGFTQVRHVFVVDGDKTQEIITLKDKPEHVLKLAEIKLGPKDEYKMSTKKLEDKTVITIYRATEVTVAFEGKTKKVTTKKRTVGELFYELGYDDNIYAPDPGGEFPLTKGMHIEICDKAELYGIAPEVEYGYNGDPYSVRGHFLETSRGSYRYSQHLEMEATAYTPADGNGNGITATGIPARYGVVAVDPDVIPLGSRLFIPGYGFAIAADTGGAIDGHIIDLCMETYDECIQFGRRDVEVFVLDD